MGIARDPGVERKRSAVGARRKQMEKALAKGVDAWLDGRPGDLVVGDLYEQFFRHQTPKTGGKA